MERSIMIALGSYLVVFMLNCSQKEENTYSQDAHLNPVGYNELSKIDQEEEVGEIRHHFREGFSSSTDLK